MNTGMNSNPENRPLERTRTMNPNLQEEMNMEQDFRYKVEHVGDAFADQMENFLDWLKASTRGISLTYNIHCLERSQHKAFARIGKRTVALKPRFPHSEIFSDDDMRDLFSEFDRIDADLARARKEREERLYPGMRTTEQEA